MASIYDTLDGRVLNKPGAYVLSDIFLVSYRSDKGSSDPMKIAIENMVIDLNIYESIYNKTLSGNLAIIDTNNVIGKLPLTGNERLEFKFYTPSLSKGYDFTIKTGNPMYVYKIQSRLAISPRSQMYILNFCSKEMLDNELIACNGVNTDTYSQMVANIVKQPEFLNSKKSFLFEPSLGLRKHVFTRIRPFDLIDQLSLVTESQKHYGAGYYFYETSFGFHYRSLDSLLAVESNTARPTLARYRPKPSNVADEKHEKDIKNEMQQVISYKVLSQFDTLKNFRNGVFSSKLITHDLLTKTYVETDFNYLNEYENQIHTDNSKEGTKTVDKGILPNYIREGKSPADFPESTLYVHAHTSATHYTESGNTIEHPPIKNILQRRLSQRLAFTSFKIELTLNGFTGLQAGDLITFEMPSYEPNDGTAPKDFDVTTSGRYLVTSIRHQLNRQAKKHIMILECMKDSLRIGYPIENIDTFIDKEKNNPGIVDLYAIDSLVFNNLLTV